MAQGGFVGVPEVRTTARSQGQIKERQMNNDLRVFDAILAVMACLLGVVVVMLWLLI
jgi:hypothetical protein